MFCDDDIDDEPDSSPSIIEVKPNKELRFNEGEWNRRDVKGMINCVAHTFNNPDIRGPRLDSIDGLEGAPQMGEPLIQALERHPGFTAIRKHGANLSKNHTIAVDPIRTHTLRFNNLSGTWSDQISGLPARQWDDHGHALLDLDEAKWVDYEGSFRYFTLNDCGFSITPWNCHNYDQEIPTHYISARERFYRPRINSFTLPESNL